VYQQAGYFALERNLLYLEKVEPQQKAAGFNSFIKIVRQQVTPAEFDRMVSTLPPDSAALVMNPPFSASWIPLSQTNPVLLAVARELFAGSDERIFDIGRQQFIADIGGVYKLFIRVATPAYVAARAGKIYQTYNRDSGNMRVVGSGEHHFDVVVENHPRPSRTLWHYIRGGIAGTLELTGVRSPTVVITEGGQEQPRSVYHVSWS
jgi:hypothetical protein